jgi:ubiquinone/menaquinone biosynthesis C-methylase UbiE
MAIAELRAAGSKRVLDVGCGTGIFSTRISEELGADVVGCDLSPGMLDQARNKSQGVGWVLGDSGRLPLGPATVDAVVCTQAFHFFDQSGALGEFRRVLVPNGVVVIAMINPRTAAGSRFLNAQGRRALGGGHWPTQRDMRRILAVEGFENIRQRRIDRGFSRLVPDVLTVASRRP